MAQPSGDRRSGYADFEIEVRIGLVRARCTLVGEESTEFVSPFDENQRDTLYAWFERAAQSARGLGGAPSLAALSLDDPRRIGEKLFVALFPANSKIRDLYYNSRAIVRSRSDPGLRIRLRLGKELERLPWELLKDPDDDYLALMSNIALVRYLDAAVPIRPLEVPGPLRVLVLAGWPERLDLNAEIQSVRQVLGSLIESGRIVLEVLPKANLDQIFDLQGSNPFHIIHYLGHSEPPDEHTPAQLLLYDEQGERALIPIESLWRALNQGDALRLIWLNSCSGAVGKEGILSGPLASAAARFIAMGVPAVLANQLRISDRAAQDLAREFYTRLAAGMPVDAALSRARIKVSVKALNSLEWATPILYMRAPDGVLFSVPQSPAASQTAAPSQAPQSTASVASDPAEADLLKGRLSELKKRLYQRQIQQARYGISADPSILIDIDELTKEIKQLEAQLKAIG
jgi:hypothetical protein